MVDAAPETSNQLEFAIERLEGEEVSLYLDEALTPGAECDGGCAVERRIAHMFLMAQLHAP